MWVKTVDRTGSDVQLKKCLLYLVCNERSGRRTQRHKLGFKKREEVICGDQEKSDVDEMTRISFVGDNIVCNS